MTSHRRGAADARFQRPFPTLPHRKKKPYKVILESVTQEKKKLRSAISYNAQAPPGYAFVPAGHPDLTEKCKELCRTRGLEVHVVSVGLTVHI